MAHWVLIGIPLLLFIHESSALRCYECTYCGDPFDHRQADKVNCTGTCGKTKRDDSGYVVRFCQPGFPESKCKRMDSAKWTDDIDVCACDTDLCNAMSRTTYVLTLISVCTISHFV